MLTNNSRTTCGKDEVSILNLLESLADAALLIRPEGIILDANSLFSSKFGRQPDQCNGLNIYDLITSDLKAPQLADTLRIKCSVVLDSGQRLVFEDSSNILKISISPVRTDDSRLSSLFILLQDISEQKQVERALQKERDLKSALLDSIPCSATILDSNLRLAAWNRYAQELVFSSSSYHQPKTSAADFFDPGDMEALREKYQNTLLTGSDDLCEIPVKPPGSMHPLWLLVRSKRIFIDDNPCVVSIGIDITERKQLEQELLESKLKYGYALDAAHSGIWEWIIATDEVIWSEQIWDLYGLTPNSRELDSQLCRNVIHPEDRDRVSELYRQAASRQETVSVEYRTLHPDGSIHWLISHGIPLRDANKNECRYIGTIIDITERKQIELELLESKRKLTFALEATNTGVWEWDIKADKVIWTDSIWKLYGLQPGSLQLSHGLCETNIHPGDRDLAFRRVMSAVDSCTDINVEYRVIHQDGSIHWLLCRGVPIPVADGEGSCYIGTVSDVTGQKNLEAAQRKIQAKFNFILEKSHLGVWDLNLSTGKIKRTPEHARIFGYDNADVDWTIEVFFEHLIPEDRERIGIAVKQALAARQNDTFECRIRTANGEIRWIWVFGAFENERNGKTGHVSGIVQDITERKRTELLLKESELKFRNIFEFSPVGIGIVDIANRSVFDVNASWLRIFGCTKQEVIGRDLNNLGIDIHEEDREDITTTLRSQGKILNKRLQLRKKNAELLNILFSAEFITLNDVSRLLVMVSDVTIQELQQANISQLEQAVAERTIQLQQEVERLQRFLNMISHEYRTPLAIIRGNLDLIDLKQQIGDFSNTRELLKIKRAIDRLVEVMEVSIHESRILESRQTKPMMPIRIHPLVSSQLDAFRAMWPERLLDFSDSLDNAEILGEPAQLKIALFNLLDNARKYSPPESPISMQGRIEDCEVVITIRNRGEHITNAQGESYFEKYRRGSNTANTAGAGLGLWLVRDIVSQHHGRVTLTGDGSFIEASVRLPLADGQRSSVEA